MRSGEALLYAQLEQGLERCHREAFLLPGVQQPIQRVVYLRQLVDSIRRVKFVSTISSRAIHQDRADPQSAMFDPIRGSILRKRIGDVTEACWLVFLFVHFGKHPSSGYRYVREVYGALGQQPAWTFDAVSADVPGVRAWLDQNEQYLRRGTAKGFGNHRKYQSLSGSRPNGTGDAFESYTNWVGRHGGHAQLFQLAFREAGGSPEEAFEWLYRSMSEVISFGRIARFDYLTMLKKVDIVGIVPGRPYLDSATEGPNRGARLLLEAQQPLSIHELESRIQTVGQFLGVGMQEMEDSLCNWGKNPAVYKYFKG